MFGNRHAAIDRWPHEESLGVTGWLLRLWHSRVRQAVRLRLVERITLGPRHSLALVEADGVRLLVATAAEGASTIYPLASPVGTDEAIGAKSSAAPERDSGHHTGMGIVAPLGSLDRRDPLFRAPVRSSARAGSKSRVSW